MVLKSNRAFWLGYWYHLVLGEKQLPARQSHLIQGLLSEAPNKQLGSKEIANYINFEVLYIGLKLFNFALD